jgi:hypothetical protein
MSVGCEMSYVLFFLELEYIANDAKSQWKNRDSSVYCSLNTSRRIVVFHINDACLYLELQPSSFVQALRKTADYALSHKENGLASMLSSGDIDIATKAT